MIRLIIILFSLSLSLFAKDRIRPNIILVMTDDQGYGDLGCHGNTVIQTPNIDQFYTDSVRLTDYHVSPTCSPTRGALLSGQFTDRAGSWHTVNGRNLLRREKLTIPQLLKEGGYQTAMFGKWHLGDHYPYLPENRGFDHALYHGGGGVGQTPDFFGNDYFDDTYIENGKLKKFEGYCTDVWFNEAMKWIEQKKDEQFFVYISTNAPHGPFLVADKYRDLYPSEKDGKKIMPEFYGMITNFDENFGRLELKLKELGLTENTILIYTTDNGTIKGDTFFNAGMSGKKGSHYEGGHRVPFFVRWPSGNIQGGRDVKELTAHVDVLPTLLSAAGLSLPLNYQLDGESLFPLFKQKKWKHNDRILITDQQRILIPRKWKQTAVMSNKWRLLDCGELLFDIEKDPAQKNNVVKQFPEVVARLTQAYDKLWDELEPTFEKKENPIVDSIGGVTCFTAHDWFGDYIPGTTYRLPWSQSYVIQGSAMIGTWFAEFEKAGKYEFVFRRWPKEVDRAINDGARFDHAVNIEMKINDSVVREPIGLADKGISTVIDLPAGVHSFNSTLYSDRGDKLGGAFYCYIKRIENGE